MSEFEIYVLFLCLIVFVLLVAVFSFVLTVIVKLSLKLIRAGVDDEKITQEFEKNKQKHNKFSKFFEIAIYSLTCIVFGVIFGVSLFMSCTQNVYFESLPTYRVVQTGSMAEKNEKNKYLFENGLDDQIKTFDLILTYKIPKEEELKLYDIVVYEVDDILIVHRIVGIEEPNEQHPNERYFLLQGDAVSSADRFPVLYSQFRGIYKGEKIPFIGSFVLFMQSPAGWLCILLVAVATIITPILENKLEKERRDRYLLLFPDKVALMTDGGSFENAKEEFIGQVNNINCFSASHSKQETDRKTFFEKFELSTDVVKVRYDRIEGYLLKIDGIRVIQAKSQRTYKVRSLPVARIMFRGKTLNVFLALDVNDYTNSKYIYKDASSVRKHSKYPMQLKITSERQTRWCIQLIDDIIAKNSLKLIDKQSDTETDKEVAYAN